MTPTGCRLTFPERSTLFAVRLATLATSPVDTNSTTLSKDATPPMKHSLRNITALALGGALLVQALTLAGAAHADGDGYADNFTGYLTTTYAQGDPATGHYANTQLPVLGVPSLEATFDAQWAGVRTNLCPGLQQSINHTGWHQCTVPATGELRAKQLGTNSIGLKYIVPNNHLNFDVELPCAPLCPDATVDVYFDVELDATLNFATSIDGDAASSTTLTVPTATVHLQNAQIHTANVIANLFSDITGKLGQEEAQLDQTSYNASALVSGPVASINGMFASAAGQLGQAIQHGNTQLSIKADPNSNKFFNLDVNLDTSAGKVVVQFRRDYFPPRTVTGVQVTHQSGQNFILVSWDSVATTSRPVLDYGIGWSYRCVVDCLPDGHATTQATTYQIFSVEPDTVGVVAENLYGHGSAGFQAPPAPPAPGGNHVGTCGVSAKFGGTGLPCLQ